MDALAPTNDFIPSGFFAVRTPLLPFDDLLAWSDGMEAPAAGADSARLEASLASDHARLRQRLRAVYARPEVRDALFLASPDLEARFDIWLHEPDSESGQKIERALVRYFARMAGRATPFGLFAGCSVGTLGAESRLILAQRNHYQRHSRLDMDYLVLLTDALARQADLRSTLSFAVNSSLYPACGRFRYCEVRRNGKGRTHHQVALEASDYLQATLARAAKGGSVKALTKTLLEADPGATQEEAEEYLDDLIANQVLVSELRPAVTGPEPIHPLAVRLRELSMIPVADRLEQARQELAAIDADGLGSEPSRYRRLAGLLQDLPGEIDLARLFQVDLVKPVVTASLGPSVVEEILHGVHLLHRLARRRRDDPLARFRESFLNRYEGREVPLVEALDEDTGIGFDTAAGGVIDTSALLDGLTFPKIEEETAPWGKREAFLLRKLSATLASGASEMVLQARDWEELAEKDPSPLPDAFAVMATVASPSESALARGVFQVLLHAASGPSGARLLGRFCHADPELHQWVQQHIQAEEALQPEAVFAEIVHLPEGRLGNILARPILRSYEIPYLGTANVPAERQLPATDLRVAVDGERIVLRSARLGRRVIPRLTSAHDFHASRGIYRFLCALQSQGTAGELGWSWGPLRDAPFLPRVVSGRLVLSRARWRINREELKQLGQQHGSARFRAVEHWREARRLPRWLALVEADNELVIDLDNVLAVETLIELAKAREQITLAELFPALDQLWSISLEGRFIHELIIPFVRKPQDCSSAANRFHHHPIALSSSDIRRTFAPGSEWLYAKLYTGPATVDQILREVVQPVVWTAQKTGAADCWFFVRYGDPDWHLRLRFHGVPNRLHNEVLPALQAAAAPLMNDGRLWRIQFDTYEQEVERYGGPEGIQLAEQLFCADSEAVLALAGILTEDARGEVRWRLAVVGMELLLTDLGLDLHTRHLLLRRIRDSFAAEFHINAAVKHQLGDTFRQQRKGLEALLDGTPHAEGPLARGREVLRYRSQWLAPVMTELKSCAAVGRLSVPLGELAAGFLHMHANRLLRSAHRMQELVLYDFLTRLYEARIARTQKHR